MSKFSFLWLLVIAGMAFSQTANVAITGHVTGPNGIPLTNTLVRMGVDLLYTTTDSTGYYSLGGPVTPYCRPDTVGHGIFPALSCCRQGIVQPAAKVMRRSV